MAKNKPQFLGPQTTAKPTQSVELVSYQRSGPLPAPAELAAYNQIIPNGADRVMKLAEMQASHRMEIERCVISSQQGSVARGQYFGLFSVLIAIGCATFAAVSGMQTFASVLGGTTVLGLAGAFVGGKYLQRKDLSEKSKSTPDPRPVQ